MMFLDVAYKRGDVEPVEYMTLCVAKVPRSQRPEFISVTVPGNVLHSNGISVTFARDRNDDGHRRIILDAASPVRVPFERCTGDDCTARVLDGFVETGGNTKEDIFQKFLDFDYVLFMFVYPDGSHKSVQTPLFSFKEQYANLP